MEKRERRERHRRNQVMSQRHGGQGNRDNRDARDNRPAPVPKPANENVIDHTAIPDPHMFDNLKRETEDIAALHAKKHGGKRQIFSNWAKYELPPDEPEDLQPVGADYEALLQGAQLGSQLQLRGERGWDPKGLPAQSAAFTIDLGALAAALACLPLHEKLQLPADVFSVEDLEQMERQARYGQALRAQGAPRLAKEGLALYGSNLEKLTSSDNVLAGRRSAEREQTPEGRAEESLDFGSVSAFKKERSVEAAPKQEESQPPAAQTDAEAETAQDTAPPRPEAGKRKPRGGRSKRRSWGQDDDNAATVAAHQTDELESGEAPASAPKEEPQPQRSPSEAPASAPEEKPQPQRSPSEAPASAPEEKPQPQRSPSEVPASAPEEKPQPQRSPSEAPASAPKEKPQPQRAPSEAPVSVSKKKSEPRGAPREAPASVRKEKPQPEQVPSEAPDSAPKEKPAHRKEDEQLDFLLSLRKPVAASQLLHFAAPTSAVRATIDEDEAVVTPLAPPAAEKKAEDLEDWLDSMLDD